MINMTTRNRQLNLVGAIGFGAGSLLLILAAVVGLCNLFGFEESWKYHSLGGILFLIALGLPLRASATCRRL